MRRSFKSGGGKLNSASTGKTFDINCDIVTLTFKDVGKEKDDILDRIVNTLHGELFGALVAEEHYANGLKHFHVWIKSKHVRLWTMKELDYIGGTHGHYLPVRQTPLKNLEYCMKEGNYIKTESMAPLCLAALQQYSRVKMVRQALTDI